MCYRIMWYIVYLQCVHVGTLKVSTCMQADKVHD